ncbi:MAG: class 1 fructose-bisphosphatase [Anaerolineales bacterium]|jgi:fructose-1,6-bisphosphatase I
MLNSAQVVSSSPIITIERHILEGQMSHPDATGTLTSLLYDVALAGKVIASQTTRAGLVQVLGKAGEMNVQGEEQMKLDVIADRTITRLNDHTGRLAVMASEEHEHILPIPDQYPTGKYVLLFDPLDGSSNIDYTIPVGTIFAIYQRISEGARGDLSDCLQEGRKLVAAGYLIYGSSTMLVYTTGHEVAGFTLDPSVGEFLLSHPNIRIPSKQKYYSTNQGYELTWSQGTQKFTRWIQGEDGGPQGMSLRYVGSLVADFHRNLLAGGVFFYPADPKHPNGKLRLLYEANPLAFIAEHAGGYASNGTDPILDVVPTQLHQRTPLFIGNRDLVEKAEEFIRQNG